MVEQRTIFYLFDYPLSKLASIFLGMAFDRRKFRALPGVTFAKLLGCGTGETFTPSDAALNRWALLLVVESDEIDTAIQSLDSTPLIKKWRKGSLSEYRAVLENISSHGSWSSREPFRPSVAKNQSGSKVAAITRARLRPSRALTFWRSIPPVVGALKSTRGLIESFGIGEAPIGLQGTFSIWESSEAIRAFAYESSAHKKAIEDTSNLKWYSEELFARFNILEERGVITARSTS